MLKKTEFPDLLPYRNIIIWYTLAVTLLKFSIPPMTKTSGSSSNLSMYCAEGWDSAVIFSTYPMPMKTKFQDYVTFWYYFIWFTIAVTLLIFSMPAMTQETRSSVFIGTYHRVILEDRKDYCPLPERYILEELIFIVIGYIY